MGGTRLGSISRMLRCALRRFTVFILVTLVVAAGPRAQAQSSDGGLLDFLERIFSKGIREGLVPGGVSEPAEPSAFPVAFSFYVIGDVESGDLQAQSERLMELIEAMERCEGAQFGLGVSPDLAAALAWTGSPALQRIRDGLTAARFVSVGSLLAPAALAALDPWDARVSLELGRAFNERLLRSSPTGYWNTGGVWRQDITGPLAAAGYSYTLVDDTVLRASANAQGISSRSPVRTSWSRDDIVLVPIDTAFVDACRKALTSGSVKQAADYVAGAAAARAKGDSRDILVCAIEVDLSAEEPGWERLPDLIRAVSDVGSASIVSVEAHLSAAEGIPSVAQVPAGEPRAISRALSAQRYSSWAQFNADDPVLAKARSVQAQVRSKIQTVRAAMADETGAAGAASAAGALLSWAELVHCWHLRNMGLVGRMDPERARSGVAALLPAHAAWQAMNPTVSAYAEDLDADGVEELVLVNAGNMFVFSPDSGDIIAWYDLANGLLMAGSGLTPRETVGGALVASGTLRSDGFTFEIGQDSKSLTFRSSSGPAFVTKAFRLEGSALKATFDIRATGSVDLTLSSFVRLSRALDVVAGTDLLAYRDPGGKGVLSAYTHGGTPLGLMSMATGAYAVVRYDGLAAEVSCTSVPFGRLVATDYALSLAPGASATVSMELESGVERITAHPIHELRRDGESIVAVVPSYTVACALRYSNLGITVSADMAAGDKAGELRAPMPEGRFTMVSQYAWGPGPIIEDAGARLEGAGSYSFFPKVEDARVTIHQGRLRVRAPESLWLGLGAALAAAVVLGAIAAVRRRRA